MTNWDAPFRGGLTAASKPIKATINIPGSKSATNRALILAAITALEVSTYYVDFGWLFMPALMIMMVIKFVMVVSYFMHLKFDNKLFSWLFYTGLVLAVGVYCAALATFKFFG